MKKLLAFALAAALILILTACTLRKYKVEIADNYPIGHKLNTTYAAGDEVTVQLDTITEHYYVLYVNGERQDMDREASDMTFTYFTFTMPAEDVLIEIEDHWVSIPESPQQ